MSHRASWVRGPLATGLAALLAVAACGGSNQEAPDAPPEPDAPEPPAGPAVLAVERVFGPEGRTYFVSVLADAPTADLDRTTATELGGSADVEVYNEAVYVRNRDDNLITRYRVSSDRKLIKDGEVSFANKGLSPILRYHNAYLTPDRAFLLDPKEWRLIEWNPTTMRLSTQPDMPVGFMQRAELPTSGTFGVPARVGNRVVSPVYWEDFDQSIIYAGSGAAIVLDATNPTVPTFTEDPRLGGAFRVYGKDNGDMFVAGSVGGDVRAFGTVVGGPMPGSGILRIPAGGASFDPDYFVDVAAITGSPGVNALHRLDDTHVLAQVFDPQAPFPANANGYAASVEFIWVMIDTTVPKFDVVTEIEKGGRANGGSHIVDGKLYIQYRAASGDAVVKRVDPDRSIHDAFTVPAGDLWHLQRIR